MSEYPKNGWKLLILKKKIFITSELLEGLQWHFLERCDLWLYLKSGLHHFSEKNIFGKTAREGGSNWPPPPPPPALGLSLLGLRFIHKNCFVESFEAHLLKFKC